jgi:hypothetical protein
MKKIFLKNLFLITFALMVTAFTPSEMESNNNIKLLESMTLEMYGDIYK